MAFSGVWSFCPCLGVGADRAGLDSPCIRCIVQLATRTPKALHNLAQGKRQEPRDCRATLGFELIGSSVEPNAFQLDGTSPRPK